jgi:hypothetical protein
LVIVAGPGERRLRLVRPSADALRNDVVTATALEIGAVGSGVDPESATHTTRLSIQLERSSLTLFMIASSEVVPGKLQQRIGIPRR